MVGQGLAYSGFAAVIWPSIPLVIPSKLIGLGYGVVTSIQNCGLAIFPLVIAAIYTKANDHYIPNVELFFVSLAVVGTVVGFYLNYYDATHDSIFNSSRKEEENISVPGGRALSRSHSTDVNFTQHGEVHRALSGEVLRTLSSDIGANRSSSGL